MRWLFRFIPASGTPQQVIDAFNLAGSRWSANLNDNITVRISVSYTTLDANTLAETDSTQLSNSYSTIRSRLVSHATSADDLSATAHLQTGSNVSLLINHTSNNPWGAGSATPYTDSSGLNNANIKATRPNLKALGFTFPANSNDATLTVNSSFSWDFNPKDGVPSGKFDLVGILTHELGHALGFVSGVDTLDGAVTPVSDNSLNFVTTLDLFRFSSQSVSLGNGVIDWTADKRDKYFSIDGGSTKIASYSTGTNLGDGFQASHWKDNQNIGIMDPAAGSGEVLAISETDRRAYDVLGYTRSYQWKWNEAAGGSWNNALNWDADGVPTAAIGATFDLGGGHYKITLNAAANAQSLVIGSDDVTLALNGRTLNIGGAVQIGAAGVLTIGNGKVIAQSISNSGKFVQTNGTLSMDGDFTNSGTAEFGGVQVWADGSSLLASGGSVTFNSDTGSSGANLKAVISQGAMVTFNAAQHLKSLSISGGMAVLSDGGRKLLRTGALSMDSAAQLDLTGNALIVQSTSEARSNDLQNISDLTRSARNGGAWNGPGITSSRASNDAKSITGLAVVLNDRGDGTPIYTDFRGEPVDVNAILVAYTYNGDLDLNGIVDADDYFRMDSGFAQGLAGYQNGDLDFSGVTDADDYFLIDHAFAEQSDLTNTVSLAMVPEPAVLSMLFALLLPGRRLRKAGA